MPIKKKDIIFYGSSTMPTNDTDTNIGGPVDKTVKMTWAPINTTGPISMYASTNLPIASQKTATVWGRNAAGELISEGMLVNGHTAVVSSNSYERILRIRFATAHASGDVWFVGAEVHSGMATEAGSDSITLNDTASGSNDQYQFHVIAMQLGHTASNQAREIVGYDGTTKIAQVRDWNTIPENGTHYIIYEGMIMDNILIGSTNVPIKELRRPFYNAAADPDGGNTKVYVEKIFAYNNHNTLALTNAAIAEVSEGAYDKITFALDDNLGHTSQNGSGLTRSSADPDNGNFTAFSDDSKNVPNSQNFSADTSCGIWLRLELPAGEAGANTYYKLQVSGQST